MAKKKRYQVIYEYYRGEIEAGRMPAGTRLLSMRQAALNFNCSYTTVETAYSMLCAEGYVMVRPQSGFYVVYRAPDAVPAVPVRREEEIRYDFTSRGAGRDPATFRNWARCVKSVLNRPERLAHYGDPQGEPELRAALTDYIMNHRNILCSPDQVVIGAGMQSLLYILCRLLPHPVDVSVPSASFRQAVSVFEAFGNRTVFGDHDAPVVYISPAQMTRWGTNMSSMERQKLAEHIRKTGNILIEDDYNNEFILQARHTPSLCTLAGGRNVIYMSSFSRLLVPGVRISYMILPEPFLSAYRELAGSLNQTASVTEQLALARYIREGHFAARIRNLAEACAGQSGCLVRELPKVLPDSCRILKGDGGPFTGLLVPCSLPAAELSEALRRRGILCSAEETGGPDARLLILNSASIPEDGMPAACRALGDALRPYLLNKKP